MKNYLGTVNLRAKFFIWSMIIILAFALIISIVYYFHLKKILMDEAFNKSEMVLQEVEAIRDYVKGTLRPRMYDIHSKEDFIIEAMSTTYISLNIMKKFGERMPGYVYRRVSQNPRNPKNSPDMFENEMFDWFEADPDRRLWQGVVKKGSEPFFMSMIPDHMDKSCLLCHGKAEDAPASLIERYGKVAGFRFTEGDLAGLNSISIPVSRSLGLITKVSIGIFIGTVLIMALLLVLLNLLFGRLVISRLTNITGFLSKEEDNKKEDAETTHKPVSCDELDHLKDSFGHLTRYVNLARKASGAEPNFIGSYAVESSIAAGTFSWLYQARHTVSNERISIKIPFDDILLNPLYAACLRAEMRMLEYAGPHNNLISVIGKEGDTLILNAVEGESMGDVIKREAPFSEKELLPLFSQLCELLAHLHNMGIVHHDLRPQNSMVTKDGVIKLFDLGYASWREIPDAIFESGIGPQGDFRYMAPEQIAGKRGDPRSDIYTLGVLLYQMCTNKLPFEKARSTLKTWLRIKEDIKPPNMYSKHLSGEMNTIILRAMAWDLQERYQWVEDLWEDVVGAPSKP